MYNNREKFFLLIHAIYVGLNVFMQYHCDHFVNKSAINLREAKNYTGGSDEYNEYMSKSEHYGYAAKQYYNFILGCLLISLIIVSIMFISILRNYQRDDW